MLAVDLDRPISVDPVINLIGIFLFAIVFHIATKMIIRFGKNKQSRFIRIFTKSVSKYYAFVIWGYASLLLLEYLASLLQPAPITPSQIERVRDVFLIISAAYILWNWKGRFEELISEKRIVRDPAVTQLISKSISIFIIMIGGLLSLDVLGVPLNALLTISGLGSLGISFAAKDVIANFFGGVMVIINRPFLQGDWIYSPNKNFEGVVEVIGWYSTRIRTCERRPTYIPNALMIDAIIENPGRMYNRRIKAEIGVRYKDVNSLKTIVDDVRSMIKNHPEIDQKQVILVHFIRFGSSSLDFEIYCFTKTTNWEKYLLVQQDVLLKISAIIDNHGAEVAFPTRTVHMYNEDTSEVMPQPATTS